MNGVETSQSSQTIAALTPIHEEIRTRIVLQNKAVELSILITSGFSAAVIVGLATKPVFLDLAAIIYFLLTFAFVQVLILANYVHQTFAILATGRYMRNFIQTLSPGNDRSLLEVAARTPTLHSLDCRQSPLHTVVRSIQQLPIYGTAIMALCCATQMGFANPEFQWQPMIFVGLMWLLTLIVFVLHIMCFFSSRMKLEADHNFLRRTQLPPEQPHTDNNSS